ncbi:MAG: 3-isopropylmalate dehydratase small subunit, partial [Actinomycetes bacterium]
DLDKRKVIAKDIEADFQIDDYVRWRLMEGLDDIGLTLRHESKITEFEKTRPSYKPITQ